MTLSTFKLIGKFCQGLFAKSWSRTTISGIPIILAHLSLSRRFSMFIDDALISLTIKRNYLSLSLVIIIDKNQYCYPH